MDGCSPRMPVASIHHDQLSGYRASGPLQRQKEAVKSFRVRPFVVLCEDDSSRVFTCEDDAWHPCEVNPVRSAAVIDFCERRAVHAIQLEELES